MTTKTTTPSHCAAVRRRVKRIFNVRLLVETLVVAAVLARRFTSGLVTR